MNNPAPLSPEQGDNGLNAGDQKVLIGMATSLLAQLQANDNEGANQTIYQLCKMRESTLFQEIGKLTRDLHDTLNSFSHDKNFEKMAQESLPDAKKRLDYVVELTEESAHKTITVVEDSLEIVNDLEKRSTALQQAVEAERNSDGELPEKITSYLTKTITDTAKINASLIEVLMAQSYQDVTGQVIQRVIKLVQDIENSLVSMIRTCSINSEGNDIKDADSVLALSAGDVENTGRKKDSHGFGPVVPGVVHDENKSSGSDTVQSQDEVDDLLSNLGF